MLAMGRGNREKLPIRAVVVDALVDPLIWSTRVSTLARPLA